METKNRNNKIILKCYIEATDRQMDALVRKLRRLTAKEIAIAEEAAR